MKKTRNSFFTEANMNYANFQSNPNMMPQNMVPQNIMPQPNIPYQASTNFNSFYSGPGVNNGFSEPTNMENRLAKMERQINRLEHRVNKLENLNTTYIDQDIDTSGNMYML